LRALRFAWPARSLPRAPAVIAGFAADRPPPGAACARRACRACVADPSPCRYRRLLAAHRAGFAVPLLAPAASPLHRAPRPTRQRKRACRRAAGPGNRLALSRAPLFSLIVVSLALAAPCRRCCRRVRCAGPVRRLARRVRPRPRRGRRREQGARGGEQGGKGPM